VCTLRRATISCATGTWHMCRAGYVFCLSYLVACGFSMCIQVLVEPLRVGETSSESALSLPKIGRVLGRIYGVATAPGRSGVPVRSSSGQRWLRELPILPHERWADVSWCKDTIWFKSSDQPRICGAVRARSSPPGLEKWPTSEPFWSKVQKGTLDFDTYRRALAQRRLQRRCAPPAALFGPRGSAPGTFSQHRKNAEFSPPFSSRIAWNALLNRRPRAVAKGLSAHGDDRCA